MRDCECCEGWIGEVGHEMRLLGMMASAAYKRVAANSDEIEATTTDSWGTPRMDLAPWLQDTPPYVICWHRYIAELRIANRVMSCRRISAWRLR